MFKTVRYFLENADTFLSGKLMADVTAHDTEAEVAFRVLKQFEFALGTVSIVSALAEAKADVAVGEGVEAVSCTWKPSVLLALLRSYLHVRHLATCGASLQTRLLAKNVGKDTPKDELYGHVFNAMRFQNQILTELDDFTRSTAAQELESAGMRLRYPMAMF